MSVQADDRPLAVIDPAATPEPSVLSGQRDGVADASGRNPHPPPLGGWVRSALRSGWICGDVGGQRLPTSRTGPLGQAVQDLMVGLAVLLPLNMVVNPKVLPLPLGRTVMT